MGGEKGGTLRTTSTWTTSVSDARLREEAAATRSLLKR